MKPSLAISAALVGTLMSSLSPAHAESIDEIMRAELAPALTANVGIAEVHLSPALAAMDLARDQIAIEVPHDVHVGRQSVKVVLRGRKARTEWVPVSFAQLVDVAVAQRPLAAGEAIAEGDIAIERRAVATVAPAPVNFVVGATVDRDVAAGAIVGAHDVTLPAPLPRGTQVAIEIRRGSVLVHGTGVLEGAARTGQSATARIGFTNTLVHGVLVAPSTLVVGDSP